MADEEEFSIEITKVLDSLAERGLNGLLRDEQKSSLRQLLRGGDLLAVLPTGFGKSLIFQALAMSKELACVLVICLLKSIVEDQILEVSSIGLSADSLLKCDLRATESGKFKLLFPSAVIPMILLTSCHALNKLNSENVKRAFFRIAGSACKRFLLSLSPPPSSRFLLLLQPSR